jgi:glycerophosphoryl diester phosphodiesterase
VVNVRKRGAGRVFISYRRQETAWPARQLYEVLVAELGADRVFKDVDDIEPGDDFVEQIQSAVGSCQVLLALIGPQWLTIKDAKGRRRLDDPEDFVRLEVETALHRSDVRVIPILVDNARMPTPQELPAGLAALARRQAVEISPVSFDTRRLLKVLNDTLNEVRQESAWPTGFVPPGSESDRAAARRRTMLAAVVTTSIVLLAAIGFAVWYFTRDPGQRTATSGPSSSISAASSPTNPAGSPSGSPSETLIPADPTGSDILAHRGGDEQYPLQTFESLTSAAEDGFAVETDVRWTSDNEAVIIHDEEATLGLRCDRPYEVSKSTWDELNENCRSFSKDGKSYPLATYKTVMEGLAGYDSWVYVEVKVEQNSAQNREFIDVIRNNGLSNRTVVTSNNRERLAEIEELAPDLPRMLFVSDKVPASQLADEKLWAVAVNQDIATKSYLSDLQEIGIITIVWTVNEERAWEKARSAGADKVLTDKPRAYAEWLRKQ